VANAEKKYGKRLVRVLRQEQAIYAPHGLMGHDA